MPPHATVAGEANLVHLTVILKIIFKWHNADGADRKDFVGGAFVMDLVVDGVAAKQ